MSLPTLLLCPLRSSAGPSSLPLPLRAFSTLPPRLAAKPPAKRIKNAVVEAKKLIDQQAKQPKADNYSPERQLAPLTDVLVLPTVRELGIKTLGGPYRALISYPYFRFWRHVTNVRTLASLGRAWQQLPPVPFNNALTRFPGFRWLPRALNLLNPSVQGTTGPLRRELEGIYVSYNTARASGDLPTLRRISHHQALSLAESLIPRISTSEKMQWQITKTNRAPKLMNIRIFPMTLGAKTEVCQVVIRFDTEQQLTIPPPPKSSRPPTVKTSHVLEYYVFDRVLVKPGSGVSQVTLGGAGKWRIRERVVAWDGKGEFPKSMT